MCQPSRLRKHIFSVLKTLRPPLPNHLPPIALPQPSEDPSTLRLVLHTYLFFFIVVPPDHLSLNNTLLTVARFGT